MKPTLEQIKTDESVWPEGAEYYTPKDNKFHDDPPRAHIWNYITRPAKAFVPEVGDHLEVTWGDKAVWHECVILPSGKIAILGYVNEVRKLINWIALSSAPSNQNLIYLLLNQEKLLMQTRMILLLMICLMICLKQGADTQQ